MGLRTTNRAGDAAPTPDEAGFVWDEPAVKRLLKSPLKLQQSAPCWSWIQQRGGLGAVRAHMRALPLGEDPRRLLALLLEHPDYTAALCAYELGISEATYFRWLADLVAGLAAGLNSWQPAVPGHQAPAAPRRLVARAPLPTPTTLLIGRAHEVAEIVDQLRRPAVRLLTLNGPGGIGKTRLAIEAAHALDKEFQDGACFVALAALDSPALVLPAIVQALGLNEDGTQPVLQSLISYLEEKQLLLVLDNVEHVIEAAPEIDLLLARAAGLKVLATSRELLRLYGEHALPVPPLQLPTPPELDRPELLAASDSIQLFVERAQAVQRGFALTAENSRVVAEICLRLEGLPLAIELAAARTSIFSPPAMLARLANRFDLLVGGARNRPERQQTLRGTIDWSYQLLDPPEQRLFVQLAVFMGGCRLEAVLAICGAGESEGELMLALESLIAKSLLRQAAGSDGELRFTMLESIREYALERLQSLDEGGTLQLRHAHYYLGLAERAEPELLGAGQLAWSALLEQEHHNLRAALHWALERQPELAARLSAALWRFWFLRGHLHEGRQLLEAALAATPQPDSLRARLLLGAGWLADSQGDYVQALACYEQALSIRRQQDERRAEAMLIYCQGRVAHSQGRYGQAMALYSESLGLASGLNDRWLIAASLSGMGWMAAQQGDYQQARRYLEESLLLTKEIGDYERLATVVLNLGSTLLHEGEYAQAQLVLEEALRIVSTLGNQLGRSIVLTNLGLALLAQGSYAEARAILEQSRATSHELGDQLGLAVSLINLGDLALAERDLLRARSLYRQGLALAQRLEHRHLIATVLDGLASTLDVLADAVLLLGAADSLYAALATPRDSALELRTTAILERARAQLDAEAFQAAWDAGRTMPLDALVRQALGADPPSSHEDAHGPSV